MSPVQILGFGVVVALALLAVFSGPKPGAGADPDRPEALSLAYQKAWLRAMPEDHERRLVLVRQLLDHYDLADAEDILQPLLDGAIPAEVRRQALLLKLDLLVARMWEIPVAAAPRFAQAREAVLKHLDGLREQSWSEPELRGLVRQANSVGAGEQALALMKQLIANFPATTTDLQERLKASEQIQASPREVAELYFAAMERSGTLAERRQNFMAGLRVLQSGDLMSEVPEAAKRHGAALENDPQTLEFLVRLMRQANRIDRAEYYVARLLRQPLGKGEAR